MMDLFGIHIDSETFVPFLIFGIPIVAIVGGITAGIVKTVTEARIVENAQRERLAAIQAGIDPSKLPPVPAPGFGSGMLAAADPTAAARHRSQGLMVGGIITIAVGIGIMAFLGVIAGGPDGEVWSVGIIPFCIGVALLLSSWLVRPRGGSGPNA